MTLTSKDLEEMLANETNMRSEVIAWRNRFPDYVYDSKKGMIFYNPPMPADKTSPESK